MTPPDTNLKKERRRHRPVLWGIAAAVLIAVLGWIAYSTYVPTAEQVGGPVMRSEQEEDGATTDDTTDGAATEGATTE